MSNSPQDDGPQNAVPPGAFAPTGDAATQRHRLADEPGVPTPGVLDELSNALASTRAAFANFLDLLTLEARRASLTLMWMVIWGVVAGICFVAAWLGLMIAFAMAAVSLGVPPIMAASGIVVVNLVLGAFLIRLCIGMSRNLLFAATRRQVAGTLPVTSPAS
jgi:hypothetical protein